MIQNNVLNNVDSEITWYKFEKYAASYTTTNQYQDSEPSTWTAEEMLADTYAEDITTDASYFGYSSYTYDSVNGFKGSGPTLNIGWTRDSTPVLGINYSANGARLRKRQCRYNRFAGRYSLVEQIKTATVVGTVSFYTISSTLDSTIQTPSELYPQQNELGYTFVENTTIDNVDYIIMKDSSNQFWAFKRVN